MLTFLLLWLSLAAPPTPEQFKSAQAVIEYAKAASEWDVTGDGVVNESDALYCKSKIPPSPSTPGFNPPIGIPQPPFGFSESTPPATHRVDATHPFPQTFVHASPWTMLLAPGSVVEFAPGTYSLNTAERMIGAGTAEKPIIFRGNGAKVIGAAVNAPYTTPSSYLIIENFEFESLGIFSPAHHIVVRNCIIRGTKGGAGLSQQPGPNAAGISDVVYYRCTVGPNGQWQQPLDQPEVNVHGLVVDVGSRVWILDSTFFHNGGVGVMFGGDHVYIGRCVAYENREAGFWTKTGRDAVVSQCVVRDIRKSNGSEGPAIGGQYGCRNVWWLFNHLYNCDYGVDVASANVDDSAIHNYAIGNLIHDIKYNAVKALPSGRLHVVGNTITRSGGIYCADSRPNGPGMEIRSNILWQLTSATFRTDGAPLWTGTNTLADPLFVSPSDLHVQPNSPAINTGTPGDVYTAFKALYGLEINKDYDGKTRPIGGVWDVGAYER